MRGNDSGGRGSSSRALYVIPAKAGTSLRLLDEKRSFDHQIPIRRMTERGWLPLSDEAMCRAVRRIGWPRRDYYIELLQVISVVFKVVFDEARDEVIAVIVTGLHANSE